MRLTWACRLCVLATIVSLNISPAWAYQRELRVPLVGCRGYYAAQGEARYSAVRNVPKVKDHEQLVIDIRNVPLPPGTVLVVYVADEMLGNIRLDSRQSGKLTITSEQRYVPPLTEGSTVQLKTVAGKLVTW